MFYQSCIGTLFIQLTFIKHLLIYFILTSLYINNNILNINHKCMSYIIKESKLGHALLVVYIESLGQFHVYGV